MPRCGHCSHDEEQTLPKPVCVENIDRVNDAAARSKRIERTTNHDVKAVEYYLRDKSLDRFHSHRPPDAVDSLRLHIGRYK